MTKKLNQGIKVSARDDTVPNREVLPHLLLSIAKPFLVGGYNEIERYKEAYEVCKDYAVTGVQLCLHEVSCLFEDLSTVAKYIELTGKTHPSHSLWFDVRNHIRHDIREELDLDERRKVARAKRLGLDHRLQANIGFDSKHIKVGTTIVTLASVKEYLDWANTVIDEVIEDAATKGMITHVPSQP